MSSITSETMPRATGRSEAARFQREKLLGPLGLSAILALAAVLLFSNLGNLGYANAYYTAGVESMLQSWHNFFFVAAEPGGSVSIDKPPVGFWLEAISAHFLGVTGFAVVLPQIIAGLLSIVVIYHLVNRKYGTVAGLIAALALAVTPVAIATERNNTIDSTLVLTLLLAAWAFIKATETNKRRYLFLGALLVGIGFNIKMLEAYLPLPAFYALYLLGANDKLRRKIGNLALASVVLVAVSFSWIAAVDLTPASQRPYVGSSGDNSALSLALGYNGIERLLGMGRGGQGGIFSAGQTTTRPSAYGYGPTQDSEGFSQGLPPGDGSVQGFVPNGDVPQGLTPGAGTDFRGAAGGFGGFMGTGQPGALRLFTAPLDKEMSWLLPFGLLGALLLAFRKKIHWPLSSDHQDLVLWGGWLLTGLVFFSIAGFFHQYYLITMAPSLAALVGIGAVGLWQLYKQHHLLAFGLLFVGAGGTLAFQMFAAQAFVPNAWWWPVAIGLFALGIVLLIVSTVRSAPRLAAAGFTVAIAALLVTPGVWSGLTTFSATGNGGMPASYSGQTEAQRFNLPAGEDLQSLAERFDLPAGEDIQSLIEGFNFPGGGDNLRFNQTLVTFLQQNTQGMKYMLAVPSANEGAEYVLATGRPVLYMGGFSGQDPVVTAADLQKMVQEGQLRYILWGGGGGGMQRSSEISSWITSQCKVVSQFSTSAGSATSGNESSGSDDGRAIADGRGFGSTLYDCAAK